MSPYLLPLVQEKDSETITNMSRFCCVWLRSSSILRALYKPQETLFVYPPKTLIISPLGRTNCSPEFVITAAINALFRRLWRSYPSPPGAIFLPCLVCTTSCREDFFLVAELSRSTPALTSSARATPTSKPRCDRALAVVTSDSSATRRPRRGLLRVRESQGARPR